MSVKLPDNRWPWLRNTQSGVTALPGTTSRFVVILNFLHCAQHFSDRPGLCDAAVRREWRLAFENFAQRSEPVHVYGDSQRLEEAHGFSAVTVYTQVRQHKGTDQPAPHRALMVGGVAILRSAEVMTQVSWLAWSKAAQPIRSEQVLRTDVHD